MKPIKTLVRGCLITVIMVLALFAQKSAIKAATINTIPSNDLTAVNQSHPLNLGSSTLVSSYWNGISGVSEGTEGVYDDCPYWNFYIPYEQKDIYTSSTFLTLNFENVCTIGGRQVNARIACTALDFTQESAIYTGDTYHKDGYMRILTLYHDSLYIVGESAGSLKLKTSITLRFDDTNEIVRLPFYQQVVDIDSKMAYISQPESWEGISGYTGDLYVYEPYFIGGVMEISGMKVSARPTSPGAEGDDSMLKAGLFAPTNNGIFGCEWGENNCGTGMVIYTAYDDRNLPNPTKKTDATEAKLPGDTITYTIDQPVNTFYATTFTYYDEFVMEDKLPEEVKYVSASLDVNGTDKTSEYGTLTYDSAAHKVTYAVKQSVLQTPAFYNGKSISLKIKTTAVNESKETVIAKNSATTNISGVKKRTGEVQTPILPQFEVITEIVNGTISPSESKINMGSNRTVTWTPKNGYYVESVTIDGVEQNNPSVGGGSHAFNNITADHNVKVVCSPYYSVTTKIDQGGNISPDTDTLKKGEDHTVSWSVKDGFYVTKVIVDGTSVYVGNKPSGYPVKYEFNDIKANHSVEVTTAKIPAFKITKTSDKLKYNYLDTVTYTIVVEQTVEGAVADDVVITDRDMTSGLELDLSSIKVDREDARIKEEGNAFSVEIDQMKSNMPVTITVQGRVNNETLESKEIRNTAKVRSTQTEEIKDDSDISVYYKVETKVTNGSITESDYEVARGESRTISYQPDDGYYLQSVKVDGESWDIEKYQKKLTLEDIKANYFVEVVYAKIPVLSIEKKADRSIYQSGDKVTYTIVVKETVKDAVAENIVVTDKELPEGIVIDPSTIRCSEKVYDLEVKENTFQIAFSSLSYGKPVNITFTADIVGKDLKKSDVKNIVRASFKNSADVAGTVEADADIVICNKIDTEVVNGSISDSVKNIKIGENRKITYNPNKGYYLASILVDGREVSIKDYVSQYDFQNIKENHRIRVVYEKIPMLAITKALDKKAYYPGNTAHFTITVRQTIEGATGRNVVITDKDITKGVQIDISSIKVKGVDKKNYSVRKDGKGFVITIPELPYGKTITITFSATIGEAFSGKEIKNTAVAICDHIEGGKAVSAKAVAKIKREAVKEDVPKIGSDSSPETGDDAPVRECVLLLLSSFALCFPLVWRKIKRKGGEK